MMRNIKEFAENLELKYRISKVKSHRRLHDHSFSMEHGFKTWTMQMPKSIYVNTDISEDGHPCEAALEFRRVAIIHGIASDINAHALDLSISFAWAGKAISRSKKIDAWLQIGIDPNTWDIIRALALDSELRRQAIIDAKEAKPIACFTEALRYLRHSTAFQRAINTIESTTTSSDNIRDDVLSSLSELSHIAKKIPGPHPNPHIVKVDNLIRLDTYRQMTGD